MVNAVFRLNVPLMCHHDRDAVASYSYYSVWLQLRTFVHGAILFSPVIGLVRVLTGCDVIL